MSLYGDCTYCRGEILEKKEQIDYRYHGQLFIMENVLVGVCNQCGEKFLTADTAKKLEQAASTASQSVRTIAIPVISIAA